jgi:hypothetical protein
MIEVLDRFHVKIKTDDQVPIRLDPVMPDYVTKGDNLDVGQQYQTLSNHRGRSSDTPNSPLRWTWRWTP